MSRQYTKHDYFIPEGMTAHRVRCNTCGVSFVSKFEYGNLCKICWQQEKAEEAAQAKAESESKSRRSKYQYTSDDNLGVVTREMRKRLLQLCHPDKHDNSKASLIATQWLNEMRLGR